MTKITLFEGNGQELTAEEINSTLDKFQKVYATVRDRALKSTTSKDWIDESGMPYLLISGAEKIKNLFGVSVTNVEFIKTQEEDEFNKYYMITYKGLFSWAMSSIEMNGCCTSLDKFLNKTRQLGSVNMSNIQKKAYTNMMGRGLKALLGLNKITWDELENLGIAKNKSSAVQYKTQEEKDKERLQKINTLRNLILNKTNNDKGKARELLKSLTTFEKTDGTIFEGHSSIESLTDKQLEIVLRKVNQ